MENKVKKLLNLALETKDLIFVVEALKILEKKQIAPEEIEFIHFFKINGYPEELALRAYNGYKVAEWRDSTGKVIKNWKQKCIHVWFRPENKLTQKNIGITKKETSF